MTRTGQHLSVEEQAFDGKPHGWIQWKGTNVCIDLHCACGAHLHCACGAHLHYDGDFLYYFICPHCERLWEMGTHMPMYEVPASEREITLKGSLVQIIQQRVDGP